MLIVNRDNAAFITAVADNVIDMEKLSGYVFWGNSADEWLMAVLLLLVCFIGIRIFRRFILSYLKRLSGRTKTAWDDLVTVLMEKFAVPAATFLAIYFAVSSLNIPPKLSKGLQVAVTAVCTYFVLKIVTVVVTEFIQSFIRKRAEGDSVQKQARGLVVIINVIIWMLGIVFLVDNFGYDVTALVAGLGIGGIAIALAAQTVLGDLFSYFVIFFDRPFEIGDFIIVDDKMGVVEYIGIKTTRIKTLNGEQLVCSNTDLTNARLHNYKRMEKRRVVFKIGVVYGTPKAKLRQIPAIVKEIILSREGVSYDRGNFCAFGDFSLDFEFVYFLDSADYNLHMEVQEQIFMDIIDAFEVEQIEFAYPTQTLFIQRLQHGGQQLS